MNEHTLQLRMSLPCMAVYVMDHCISRARLHADYKPFLSPDVHTRKGC